MKLRARFRAFVQQWLGLVDLPSLTMFKAMELKQAERHAEVTSLLRTIEQRMVNAHIGQPQSMPSFENLSWEAVEAMALHSLNSTPPPKEYQDV